MNGVLESLRDSEKAAQPQELPSILFSYFGNWRKFPTDYIVISIAHHPPRGWAGPQDNGLAPAEWLLAGYKNNHDWEWYAQAYKHGLTAVDLVGIAEVWLKSAKESGRKGIIFCCYEKDNQKCHRSLLMEMMREKGLEVAEI